MEVAEEIGISQAGIPFEAALKNLKTYGHIVRQGIMRKSFWVRLFFSAALLVRIILANGLYQ